MSPVLCLLLALASLATATELPAKAKEIQTILDRISEIETQKASMEEHLTTLRAASKSLLESEDPAILNLVQVPDSLQRMMHFPAGAMPQARAPSAALPAQMQLLAKPAQSAKAAMALKPYPGQAYVKMMDLMSIWHTDLMALSYVYCFWILGYKVAVESGGFVRATSPKAPVTVAMETHTKKSRHLSKRGVEKELDDEDRELAKEVSDIATLESEEEDSSAHAAFLQVSTMRRRKDEAMPFPKLSIPVILNIAAIWWDILANMHIVMASLYSIPSCLIALRTTPFNPKVWVTYTRVLAFWYWGWVQWLVDLFDIYALVNPKFNTFWLDAWALRVKDLAFSWWMIENWWGLLQIGIPTKQTALQYLLTLDHMKLVELAKACIYIGYMSEGKFKASVDLSKMVPAYGINFAWTALHSDIIAKMLF